MKEYPNYEREGFEGTERVSAMTLTDEQQQLLKNIKGLEQEMFNRRHDTRWTNQQNAEHRERRLHEIQVKFYEANTRAYEVLQEQAEKHKAEFLRKAEADPARLLLQQQRWLLKYGNMTREQLDAEAIIYGSETDSAKLLSWTPDRLDALSSAMMKKGQPDGVLEQAKEQKRYEEPWRYEKPEVYQAMELYRPEYGRATVINSAGQIEKINIQKIYMERTKMENEE